MSRSERKNTRPTYEQLEGILRRHECIDGALEEDLEQISAIAWLAHHARAGRSPGYNDEDYEIHASHAFMFISIYLTERMNNFNRTKEMVTAMHTGENNEGSDHA